jgi:hypothetical protein
MCNWGRVPTVMEEVMTVLDSGPIEKRTRQENSPRDVV